MPFTSYTTISDVARAHRISCERAEFPPPAPIQLSHEFQSELALTMRELPSELSDFAIREMLIYPLLREVWKPFREVLTLWIHQPIAYDEDLSGTPDYIVARRSPLGHLVFDPPCCLVVVQAQSDGFERGWGNVWRPSSPPRKSAAPRKIRCSESSPMAWTGISESSGKRSSRRTSVLFTLSELDQLAGALHTILHECGELATPQPRFVIGETAP